MAVLAAAFIGARNSAPRPPLVQAQKAGASAPIVPKEVRTIPIVAPKAAPLPPTPSISLAPPPPRGAKRQPPSAQPRPSAKLRDICRGKGKLYRNNKRSWRCKRG